MLISAAMSAATMSAARGPSRQRFLDAAFGRATDVPPVWLMRQAGRYLPEYREVRKRLKFLELCADVPAAIEVTLQPFRRFGMDGIVFFSDILIPLPPMGIEVQLGQVLIPLITKLTCSFSCACSPTMPPRFISRRATVTRSPVTYCRRTLSFICSAGTSAQR